MKNGIEIITKEDYEKMKILNSCEDTFYVTIDGERIQSWEDYWNTVSKEFRFPELPKLWKPDNHSYYDFMTDLEWIEKDKFVLEINNYEQFLRNDDALKTQIINNFRNYLLPFWEEEVERTVVGGKRKSFIVYLVQS